MKKLFISIVLSMILVSTYCDDDLNISTMLIVLEETENTFQINKDTAPFSDGVMDAMWNMPYVFFDMKIDKPLEKHGDNLDIRPFMQEAKSAGADSLLLIKFEYQLEKIEDTTVFSAKEIPYILYSIKDMKVLRAGKKEIGITRKLETKEKQHLLRSLGADIATLVCR